MNHASTKRTRRVLAIALSVASGCMAASDISGFWALRFDSKNVPMAELSPKFTKAALDAHLRKDADAIRWCNHLGVPFVMDDPSSGPIDIRQGRVEVAVVSNVVSVARHLYIDGRKHVNPDAFDPTTSGDSVGRWEGDTLIVDTIGIAGNRGITSIPGGGFRTDKSHLVERYRLLEGGKQLSVTFTWDDPDVFRVPHTYQYIYYRAPAGSEGGTLACNPFDEQRTSFLTGTPK
jgi:hypothetical protein